VASVAVYWGGELQSPSAFTASVAVRGLVPTSVRDPPLGAQAPREASTSGLPDEVLQATQVPAQAVAGQPFLPESLPAAASPPSPSPSPAPLPVPLPPSQSLRIESPGSVDPAEARSLVKGWEESRETRSAPATAGGTSVAASADARVDASSGSAAGTDVAAVAQVAESHGLPPTERQDIEREIARVVRMRAGVYIDKAAHQDLARVVLVTAANFAYWSIYQNWRCAAQRLGLDWAVVANDDEAYKRLGSNHAIPVVGHKVESMVGWGNVKLDYVGWNKMMNVWLIMNLTQLDVVFTDCDNVFLKDPFRHGISLGDLIRSESYDYLYQPELSKRPPKGYKSPGDGGNTGFFFAAGSRKPAMIQALFQAVVIEVDSRIKEKGHGADQNIFWQVFNQMRSSKGKDGPWGFKCAKMCGRNPTCKASSEDTIEYCGMDPFVHPTGWDDADKWVDTIATYHSNYATNEAKIKKLQKVGMWGLWNADTKKCSVKDGS